MKVEIKVDKSLTEPRVIIETNEITQEEWSLLRQTFTHLIVCSVFTFPVAYVCYWMPHNLTGVLSYFGIFFVIYFSIWISQHISIKSKIKKMNKKIAK